MKKNLPGIDYTEETKVKTELCDSIKKSLLNMKKEN